MGVEEAAQNFMDLIQGMAEQETAPLVNTINELTQIVGNIAEYLQPILDRLDALEKKQEKRMEDEDA